MGDEMMFRHLRLAFTCAIGAAVIHSAAVQAADNNTRYVSITGKNANPCTLSQPCRSLQRGINVTPPGGELRILDSGNYGANGNINKSLTITGNGNTVYLGGILTVDNAGATVALRNLVLDGQGTIADGIRINNATAVHIERCVIHSFTAVGILSTATDVELFVLDTISRDNGREGFDLSGDAGLQRATIDNSRFESNGSSGARIDGGRATISRTIASNNGGAGIIILPPGSSVMVRETTAAHNGSDGFRVSAATMTVESSVGYGNSGSGLLNSSGVARISNSTFTDNAVGITNINGGTVQTRGNNTVQGNTTDIIGALTPITGK
jgi:hypothetical protein